MCSTNPPEAIFTSPGSNVFRELEPAGAYALPPLPPILVAFPSLVSHGASHAGATSAPPSHRCRASATGGTGPSTCSANLTALLHRGVVTPWLAAHGARPRSSNGPFNVCAWRAQRQSRSMWPDVRAEGRSGRTVIAAHRFCDRSRQGTNARGRAACPARRSATCDAVDTRQAERPVHNLRQWLSYSYQSHLSYSSQSCRVLTCTCRSSAQDSRQARERCMSA